MKKEGVLLLVLLAGIPGCGGKKYDTVYEVASVEEQTEEAVEYVADGSTESIRSFFNEETGTFEVDEFDEQFIADLEEWVFADDLEFPSIAENVETDPVPETIEVAEVDTESGSDDTQQQVDEQQLEETFKTVFFDKGSAELREDQKEVVAHNIVHAKKIMEEYRDDAGHPHPCTLVVEGHADSGSESEEVSQLRARTLANAFIEAGISEECICVASRGADVPMVVDGELVDADSAEQWANRRSEIHMICA